MEQINRMCLLKFLNPYEVTLSELAQINDGLLDHMYKALELMGGMLKVY